MSLQSFGYFGFLLVVAAVYLHLPQRVQPRFLLAASWLFYAMAAPGALPLMLAVALGTWGCGLALQGPHGKVALRAGVLGSLGVLALFKYGAAIQGILPLPLPPFAKLLGLSYYSFTAIAYLVDAARGDCEVERDFFHYALFLNFFATVTQGPICRAGDLLPQLKAEQRFDAARLTAALRLFALGLFKTVAVSDVLGVLTGQVLGHYQSYGGPMLLVGVLGYTLQLYFNFSGYSELARATGLVLGLQIPENFKTPFYATNFSGFWSRWHISLSSWLQDYLFMPLAWADTSRLTGGKLPRLPVEVCVFLVFFASGFWHGNTLPFVVWGLLQALYRVGEELIHRRFGKPKKKAPAKVLWAKRAGVFVLWCFGMVFFSLGMQGGTVADCFAYLAGCAAGWSPARFEQELYSVIYTGFYANPIMVAGYYAFLALVLVLAFWLDHRRNFVHRNRPAEVALAAEQHRWVLYYLLVCCIWVGYIMQSGGFGGAAGFGMYANF